MSAAEQQAIAMVTATTDVAVCRDLWENRTVSEWELVHALSDLAGAAIEVLAECQGRTEEEVLASLGLGFAG